MCPFDVCACRVTETCYLTMNQALSEPPINSYVNITGMQDAFDAFLPQLAKPSAGPNFTASTCMLVGPFVSQQFLEVTQMSKWECVAVLFGIAMFVRLGYFVVLTFVYKNQRK